VGLFYLTTKHTKEKHTKSTEIPLCPPCKNFVASVVKKLPSDQDEYTGKKTAVLRLARNKKESLTENSSHLIPKIHPNPGSDRKIFHKASLCNRK